MQTRIGQLLDRCGRPAPRGFTLIEMLVAVGAVALVGVAIATVFEAVGKTVGVGKRMGTLNSYANLIQQQMERDFASITREGFLVIRNEMADADADGDYDPPNAAGVGGDSIPLHVDDLTPRPRRIDEVMFFCKGDFASAREALDPRFIARSDAASIYYGMGKRRRSDSNATGEYLRPTLDLNVGQDPNSWLGQQATGNPNRFASDWTLLRLVRVLAPLRSTQATLPGTMVFGMNAATGLLEDRDHQVALQPAASSLFRALNVLFPVNAVGVVRDPGRGFPQARPSFASGLVDVATTSLEEVRLIVTTADTWPGAAPAGQQSASANFFDPVGSGGGNDGPDGSPNAGVDGKNRRASLTLTPGYDIFRLRREQAWMDDAMPAWDTADDVPNDRERVRYEPEPPNYMGVLALPDGSQTQMLQKAAYRADQLMLSSSNFVPRCTEFMVEWSLGRTYPSDPSSLTYYAGHEGEIIWHGMERLANGRPPSQVFNSEDSVARPFVGNFPTGAPWMPAASFGSQPLRLNSGGYTSQPVIPQLIHGWGFAPATMNPGDELTSYFGYTDPFFNPDKDNDGRLDSPDDAASPTIPWAWPKLIRVTIGLADPNDPSFEQRYQFVFTLPEQPAP